MTVSTNQLRLFTVVSSSVLTEAPPPPFSSALPCPALLCSLRDKVPCPPQDEEVLEAPVEEEEVDPTTAKTSTSREEVRCVKTCWTFCRCTRTRGCLLLCVLVV